MWTWGLAPGWVPRPLEATCSPCCQAVAGGPLPDGPSLSPEEGPPQPRLEDEIDLLAQELARQEAGRWKLMTLPHPEAPHRLLEAGETPAPSPLTARPPSTPAQPSHVVITCLLSAAATLGLSDRGQGPDLGLPSTRGAPAQTTHTSLGSPVSSGPVHMSPVDPQGGRGDGFTLGRSGWTGRRVPPGGRPPSPPDPPARSVHRGVLRGGHSGPRCGCSLLVQVSGEAGWGARTGGTLRVSASIRPRRLQRDIRLTQKADYAAPQAPGSPATPKISVCVPALPGSCLPAPGPSSAA